MEHYFIYCGLIASIWIVVGIFIAAKRYPNYSHMTQFCSELGAKGSPTEKFSPMINNYPLGVLFCLFGIAVINMENGSMLTSMAGTLIISHGIGTWVAGYFPMDADAYTKTPTLNCQVHSWAGFIMLIGLLIAPVLIIFSPTTASITSSFKVFSCLTTLATIYFIYTLIRALKNKVNPGLHQRLGYGSQLLWLSGLSLALI